MFTARRDEYGNELGKDFPRLKGTTEGDKQKRENPYSG